MQVDEFADAFLETLDKAALQVVVEYLDLPMRQASSGDAGAARLERVYCYELYHQARVLLDAAAPGSRLRDAVDFGYRLNGEVDKRSNTLPSSAVPDFLWHVPGGADNSCVVEVKRASASPAAIVADVNKIATFASDCGYSTALLLVVGDGRNGMPTRRMFARVADGATQAGVHLRFHTGAGSAPVGYDGLAP